MTNAESIWQRGNNAYGKPATALNILRETVIGRENFDYAFKTYCTRWAFKHPSPADLFRTMEDASGVDLDWFWRGWFYTTDHVDIALTDVQWLQISSQDPNREKPFAKEQDAQKPDFIGDIRNAQSTTPTVVEADPTMRDFYNSYDPYKVDQMDELAYQLYRSKLSADEIALLDTMVDKHIYSLSFKNEGGLVMPLILRFTYEDKTSEVIRIPAEIWKMTTDEISKVFIVDQPIIQIEMDPFLETADTDVSDNMWPRRPIPTRIDLFKRNSTKMNPMQRAGAGSKR